MSYGFSISLETIVFTALGQASMCWSEIPKGVFEASQAVSIGHNTVRQIEEMIDQIIENNNSQRRELKVCTGCGRFSDDPISEYHLACCPDNRYKPIKEAYNDLFEEVIRYKKASVYDLDQLEVCCVCHNIKKPNEIGCVHADDYVQMKKYISIQRSVVESMKESHKQQHERIKSLDNQVFNLDQLNQKLSGIINEVQDQNQKLKSNVDLLSKSNQSYHENNMKLINEINQYQSENCDLKNQISELNQKNADLELALRNM